MRTLGIDHGSRRFGLALGDPTGRFSRPLDPVDGEKGLFDRLPKLICDEGISRIVVGLPLNMDGSLGRKAQEVLKFAALLRERFPLAVETWDERLTTVQAERRLREAGVSPRRWKEHVDSMAAQILLQSYLDAHSPAVADEGSEDREATEPNLDEGARDGEGP